MEDNRLQKEANSHSTDGVLAPLDDPKQAQNDDEPEVKRLGGFDTLEPGTYWRAKNSVVQAGRTVIRAQDVHLLMDVHLVDGDFHSVNFLCHPRSGSRSEIRISIDDFFSHMEPCHNHEEVRAAEKAAINAELGDIQKEMAEAGVNPMANEEVRKRAEKALKDLEDELGRQALMAPESQKKRKDRLSAIHRRAARRSAAAGNPLVERKVVVSNSVADMIGQKVSTDSLVELQVETKRRQVIAEAAATYLSERTQRMGRVMEALTPYFAEQAQVALAKSKGAIRRAKEIHQGLSSLSLYTGDDVDVLEVTSGKEADPSEPLVLYQAKKFMDECMCAFVDIEETFDWTSQSQFFDLLKSSPALRDTILPAQRSVVSMAVTQRSIDYSHVKDINQLRRNWAENQSVFLLARNGDNVHAIYSSEPSHEVSPRLFPTSSDLKAPFSGIDGSQLKLTDLNYVEAASDFERMALHYKRFLILLCGLDHRLQLFGRFYPPEEAMNFMTVPFQSAYFSFVRDDDEEFAIGDAQRADIATWFAQKNKALVSGSRLVINLRAIVEASPGFKRRTGRMTLIGGKSGRDLAIARREGDRFYVEVIAEDRQGDLSGFKCWLDDHSVLGAWLCVDTVLPSEIDHYLLSRNARASSGVRNILTLKRVRSVLEQDARDQVELRAYLRHALIEGRVMPEEGMDDQILLAINAWRSANRGEPAPALGEVKAVQQILNVLYPKDALKESMSEMAERLSAQLDCEPLRLVQTGKDKLVLYTVATTEDVAQARGAMHFGWVRRRVVQVTRRANGQAMKEISSKLVWSKSPDEAPDEKAIFTWPINDSSYNGVDEPVALPHLLAYLSLMDQVTALGPRLTEVRVHLKAGKPFEELPFATGEHDGFVDSLMVEAAKIMDKGSYARSVFVSLPVGVTQREPRNAVNLMAMRLNVVAFARMLCSRDAFARAMNQLYRRYPTSRPRLVAENFDYGSFRLVEFRPAFSGSLFAHGEALSESVWATNKPAGVKRKHMFSTQKPKKGQTVLLRTSVEAQLSHNRAIDRFMLANDFPRRTYHRELRSRYPKNWPWRTEEEKKRMKAPYVPAPASFVYLSPLVWDPVARRSKASSFFPGRNT